MLDGYKVSGYNFEGKKSLESIGNVIYYNDYRRSIVKTGSQVLRVNDLSGNQINWTPTNANVQYYTSPSAGWGSTINTINSKIPLDTRLKKLINGSAFAIYTVLYIGDMAATGTVNPLTLNSSSFDLEMVSSQFRFRVLKNGSTINGPANIVSGEVFLAGFVYKGSGAGTGNAKIRCKDASTTGTVAGTSSADITSALNGKAGGQTDWIQKMNIVYDLSGKTALEIDAFDTEFVNVLKSDPEYSSLTT